jgi:hypothetical protein
MVLLLGIVVIPGYSVSAKKISLNILRFDPAGTISGSQSVYISTSDTYRYYVSYTEDMPSNCYWDLNGTPLTSPGIFSFYVDIPGTSFTGGTNAVSVKYDDSGITKYYAFYYVTGY